jgi:hypothetical protein
VIRDIATGGTGVLVVDEDSARALDAADRWYYLAAREVQAVETAAGQAAPR